ncbi:methyltransferase domain-containing protein [Helicobacter vulpis]|uniref:methyltransferase domain-containing protein n=1 Tax=Helicobacter vulpis TaxID=2316076 RepID=UPI001F29BD1E|nr:methyltransferase domain-containing protein [Helicobacter vulpis]
MQREIEPYSFGKRAKSYARHAGVQQRIAARLLQECAPQCCARMVDLGCGQGSVLNALPFFEIHVGEFIGVDRALEMLQEHPRACARVDRVRLICQDFETWETLPCSLLVSASALQWARDLDGLCAKLARACTHIALAIHTRASLQEVHTFLGTNSPLRGCEEVLDILKARFEGFEKRLWVERFQQIFDGRAPFLAQLKYAGLLGGGLDFKRAKALRFQAPYESLSYEVVFLVGHLQKGLA